MRSIIILVGCIFIFSCKKDPVAPVDCAGVSGGNAKLDNCGICDADPTNNCVDCTSHFTFNPSQNQASYFFLSVIISGGTIESEDSVGAFNGSICVGARKWDTSLCLSGVCDVPVMGDDGYNWSADYMQSDNIPIFKIYDVSEGLIYNTKVTGDIPPWQIYGQFIIDTLVATTVAPCQ